MNYIKNLTIEINDIPDEDVDNEILNYQTRIEKNLITEFKKMFQNEYTGDLNDNKRILYFLYNERNYIDKLMDFDSEIKLENILNKTTIIQLIQYFEIKLAIDELEKKKWVLVENNNNQPYFNLLYIFNHYLQRSYQYVYRTYMYLRN
jgi:hypothetical protein